MNWSIYQENIFDHISGMFASDSPNLTVRAYAGTGKTTTLVQGLSQIPGHVDSVFVAFNVSIKNELGKRLPAHIEAKTLHGLGLANLTKLNKVKVEQYKMHNIFDVLVPPPVKWADPEIKNLHSAKKSAFVKAIGWIKNSLVDWHNPDAIWTMLEELDLDGFENEIQQYLVPGMEMSMNNQDEVDFDDMIYLPAVLKMPIRKYGFVGVDEAQDLNPAQIQLVLKTTSNGGKAVVIGDERQSIYGFRGADEHTMGRLIAALKSDQLPLPITYRCPVSVVEYAKRFVPDLQAREGAPIGIMDQIKEEKMAQLAQAGDMILCRINAPLVPLAFQFLKQGMKATVMGHEIGKNLSTLAKKAVSGSETMKDVYDTLYEMRMVEIQKIANNQYIKNPDGKIARIDDKYDTLVAVADGMLDNKNTNPQDFPNQVQDLFSDTKEGVVLSTVHKAKGLEAHRVFIVRPDLIPHPLAKSEYAKAQEANLEYVAVTRSKSELYFVQ